MVLYILGLAAVGVHLSLSLREDPSEWVSVLYCVILFAAASAIGARSIWIRDDERLAWALMGIAIGLGASSELLRTIILPADGTSGAMFAQIAWLTWIPCLAVGAAVLVRGYLSKVSLVAFLDMMASALVLAAVAAIAFSGLSSESSGRSDGVGLWYPVGEIFLLGLLTAFVVIGKVRFDARWLLVGAALAFAAVADAFYLVADDRQLTHQATAVQSMWAASALMLTGASWLRSSRRLAPVAGAVRISAVAGALALAVILADHFLRLDAMPLLIAGAALSLVITRLALSLSINERLLENLGRREAEQQALRRIATAVADQRGTSDVFKAIAHEAGGLLGVGSVRVVRFRRDAPQVVASWPEHGFFADLGKAGGEVAAAVLRQGESARHRSRGRVVLDQFRLAVPADQARPPALGIPIWVGNQLWGALITLGRPGGSIAHPLEDSLARFAELAGIAITSAQSRELLESRANSDPLTGLANHRAFYEFLQVRIDRARAAGGNVAVAMIDLDHFKEINDNHGHAVGDQVLTWLSAILSRSIREGDLVARVGGEEFAFCFPNTDAATAQRIVDQVRESISAEPFGPVGFLHASAGVSDLRTGAEIETIVSQCDDALYWAKWQGRNASFVYTPDVMKKLSSEEQARLQLRSQALAGLRALARAVDAKDSLTLAHSERVSELSVMIARKLGWDLRAQSRMRDAARLHDVGKIGVPDAILFKDGPLDAQERGRVETHVSLGAEIAGEVLDAEQVSWIRHHHENWDGSGYAAGLQAEAIPLGARIISVADVWDVITSKRSYKQAGPPELALAEMRRCAGSQFDPELVDTLLGVLAEAGVVSDEEREAEAVAAPAG